MFRNGRKIQGPQLPGMSGCGIWLEKNTLIFEEGKQDGYVPAGIAIEYDYQSNYILVTRINVIAEILKKEFDLPINGSQLFKYK